MNMFDVLEGCAWESDCIVCKDYATALTVNKFIKHLVYDSKLSVIKATGFRIVGYVNKSTVSVNISRSKNLGDSFVEISRLLSDKVFPTESVNNREFMTLTLEKGYNNLDDGMLFGYGTKRVPVFYEEPYVGRALQGQVKIDIAVREDSGYSDMSYNSSKLPKNTYFPMNTYFTLVNYVRVVPPARNSNQVRINLCNGMTMAYLRERVMAYVVNKPEWNEDYILPSLRDLYNMSCK